MTPLDPLSSALHSALLRVRPYKDRLPISVGEAVDKAILDYEMAVADAQIVQRPKERCTHAAYHVVEGKCAGCGAVV